MKHLEAVFFDWAGTTVDYGCIAPIIAMQKAFAHHHLAITLDEIRKPMGMLKIDHIKAILNMERVEIAFHQQFKRNSNHADLTAIYEHFEASLFSNLNDHTQLIPGIIELQNYLRQHHIKIGSTSGYTKEMLSIVANNAKSQGYTPDFFIASDEVKYGRPYPYMIFAAANALEVKNIKNTVKIGDTLVDIEEGLNAGCWTIGIVKGSSMLGLTKEEITQLSDHELQIRCETTKQEMLNAGAHFVATDLFEIPSILNQLGNHHAHSL